MASRYPSQTFELHPHPPWASDLDSAPPEDDDSSVLDEKILDPSTPAEHQAMFDRRRFSVGHHYPPPTNVWQDRPHGPMGHHLARHYSQPVVPMLDTSTQPYVRYDPHFGAAYTPSPHWAMSIDSGASTPAIKYEHGSQGYGINPQIPYHHPSEVFPPPPPSNNPVSAIPMSPQSSHGEWASPSPSDTPEPGNHPVHSPRYRAASPLSALRADGIRKKNARFEIPKDRNLQNIDSMIMASTDEAEKKELKQQKRLLRNRQAALDSRQRKKTHTDNLEKEKKGFTRQIGELGERANRLEAALLQEREQWMHQEMQLKQMISNLQYERDDAIRTRTLETGDLRRKNIILMEHLREMENQHHLRHASDNTFTPHDLPAFDNLGLDDSWQDDFSIIDGAELSMENASHESLAQQSTPKPAPPSKDSDGVKSDAHHYSWNALCMCILTGAFMVSNAGSHSNSHSLAPAIPALSEEYRAEARNVLKAVLASGPESAFAVLPSRAAGLHPHEQPTHISGAEMARMSSAHDRGFGGSPLEHAYAALTQPTRHQQELQAFGLNAEAYNHIANPDPFITGGPDDDDFEIKPTPLQAAWSGMQEHRAGIDRMLSSRRARGIVGGTSALAAAAGSGSAPAASGLWDRVPEKVLRDFKEMVRLSEENKSPTQMEL